MEIKKNNEKSGLFEALTLAYELGYMIAIPLLGFGILGRFLDTKFGSSPLLFLCGLFFSVVATTIWLCVKLSVFTKDTNSDAQKTVDKKVE